MSEREPQISRFRLTRCPLCKREETAAFRPFCSKRCADLDLSRWLTGGYAIPADETNEPVPGEEPD